MVAALLFLFVGLCAETPQIGPLIDQLKQASIAHDQARMRRSREKLVASGDGALKALIPLLDDPHRETRDAAFATLKAIGTDAAMERMVANAKSHLTDGPYPFGRGEGIDRLKLLGPASIPTLVRQYSTGDPNNSALLDLASEWHTPELRPLYLAALEEREVGVVQRALIYIAGCRCQDARKVLVSFLDDNRSAVRFGAILGLERLRDRSAIAALEAVLKEPDASADLVMDNSLVRAVPMTLHQAARHAIATLKGAR